MKKLLKSLWIDIFAPFFGIFFIVGVAFGGIALVATIIINITISAIVLMAVIFKATLGTTLIVFAIYLIWSFIYNLRFR